MSCPNMDSCRVCMTKHLKMSEIQSNIIDKIEFCTGVLVNKDEGLPTVICEQCLDDLLVAHRFKNTCINSDIAFRRLLPQFDIKDEKLVSNAGDDFFSNELNGNQEIKNEILEDERNDEFEDCDAEAAIKSMKNIRKLRGPRGPYKKSGKPRQLKKLKFRRLYCEPCGRKFVTKQELDDHRRDLHKEPQFWICEVCGKTFIHQASLYSHVRSHLPPKFSCEQCDYRTWQKHDLVKHVRIHTGVKLYQCEFCTASFYTSSNLTCHKRRFHDGVKRFQCATCDMKFYDKTKLNRHVDTHNDVKRFECHICHSCFTRRCHWKKHLTRQHNIEIPKMRPGRQKINFLVGCDMVKPTDVVLET